MNKWFTLIEILVVIVIVGILSAFIIVSMAGVSEKAAIAKGQAFSSSLKNSLMMNLVSEWNFEGPTMAGSNAVSSDVLDTWGNGDGNIESYGGNYPVVRSGKDCLSGKCLEFSGSGGSVMITDSLINSITNKLTISFWVWFDVDLSWGPGLVWKGGYNYVVGHEGGGISFRAWNSSGTASTSTIAASKIPLNKWHNIVASFDGSSRIYLNAVGESVGVSVGTIRDQAGNLYIGRRGDYSDNYFFNGKIDEVKLYNESIPSFRIEENYYSSLNKLLAKNGIDSNEFNQRITELKFNSANNE